MEGIDITLLFGVISSCLEFFLDSFAWHFLQFFSFEMKISLVFLILFIFWSNIVVLGKIWPLPPFKCPKLPTPPPATDVRQLRPGNIKMVMALGDSITVKKKKNSK